MPNGWSLDVEKSKSSMFFRQVKMWICALSEVRATISERTIIMSLASRPKPTSRVSSQRLPPPSLFQGPPSRNESSNSLHGLVPGNQGPASAQRPGLQRSRSRMSTISPSGNRNLSPFLSRTQSPRETDSAEIQWQEMQNTLGEVELSAFKGEHVFGEEHSRALEELRLKQLKLAQTWTRNEADEVDENESRDTNGQSDQKSSGVHRDHGSTTTIDGAATYKALEAETEKDLQQARKRRLANDQYFDRVNNGVLDVVASLEEVAQAMRTVRKESEDIWNDTASESLNVTGDSTTG
ncbi:conserved hypothetical protein [Talaromyces stipitatus ATCC 10500]|uniref:Uncharacterized protein n=1 Tax=Talaromyces stipitatus (strain ATCC 10500 / CBS 375.48 / QM 6759 / NRRL 1006) TaxID=441959 RepID=B8LVF2_TALSN|nr:uncharacterized protein TSTA_073600 [Talaromyces stipitatus ATCC 10500]EED23970.1 conserved hypothetical protein [Talaromyces stipitatus ATCC 10500]